MRLLIFSSLLLSVPANADTFSDYLTGDIPPADGFDFPVGDKNSRGSYTDLKTGETHRGWYVATQMGERYALGLHTGEDWNGRGGQDTDLGQPVYAIGAGRVVYAQNAEAPWGGVIMIDHVYYENHHRRTVRSQYAHLSRIDVKVGDLITRRQSIGAIGKDPEGQYPAHLHLEIRSDLSLSATYWPSTHGKDKRWLKAHYLAPSPFIKARRSLFVPQDEPVLILVEEATHKMARYERGKLVAQSDRTEVAFGQAEGRKRIQGDLKTPKGMYFVVYKHRGKFTGAYGDFYGGHWIKLNYPNPYDAKWGQENGLISKKTAKKISRDWRRRKLTNQKTRLGGGIGFHGWAGPWALQDSGNLSWGCIVMHNEEIKRFYDRIPKGAMVIIF